MKSKLFTVLVVLAASGAAFAIWASIYGKWSVSVQNGKVKATINLEVKEGDTTFAVHCDAGGETSDASVTVPTKVEGNQLHILGSANKSGKAGGMDCSVNVIPDTYTFEVTDTNLKLSTKSGQQIVLSRVK